MGKKREEKLEQTCTDLYFLFLTSEAYLGEIMIMALYVYILFDIKIQCKNIFTMFVKILITIWKSFLSFGFTE